MIKNDGKIDVEGMKEYANVLANKTMADSDSFPFDVDEFKRGVDMFKLAGDDVDAGFSLNDDFIDLNRNTEYEFADESLYEDVAYLEDTDEHYGLNTSSIFPDFMKDELETTAYWQDDCFIKQHKTRPYNIAEHFNSTLGVNVEAAEPTIFTFKVVGPHYIAITGLKHNIDIKGDYGGVLTIPNTIRFGDEKDGYIRYIAVEAFIDNPAVEHVVLGENVQVIEDYAFSCPNLKSISGLSGVLSIAPTAFMGTQLLDTDSVYFNWYSDECEILSEFDVEYEVKGPYIFITKYVGEKTNIIIPARLSDKLVVGISEQAFKGTKVYSVKLPDSIKIIGSTAFAFSDLRDISMPDGLLAIGDEAFAGTLLNKAYLPSTLVHIGRAVFACCRCLSSVRLPDSLTQIPTALFAGCTALSTIILPKNCISISNGAFYDCRNLKYIPLPSYIENIGEAAFKGCHMLSYIELPQSLRYLGTAAFANCDNLESVHIADKAFEGTDLQRQIDNSFGLLT